MSNASVKESAGKDVYRTAAETPPRHATEEERRAWDMFAAAVLSLSGCTCVYSAECADKMLELRRKRF